MSAWIVTRAHIDVLVGSLVRSEVVHFDHVPTPDELGARLWAENYRSVNYRYDEQNSVPDYTYTAQPVPPVAALYKAWRSYGYQSCEHDAWERSEPYRWYNEMSLHLETHPEFEDILGGDGWSITQAYLDSLTEVPS